MLEYLLLAESKNLFVCLQFFFFYEQQIRGTVTQQWSSMAQE